MSEEQLIKTPSVFGETGNFLLEREVGAGGMGGVYMGRDKMLDRPVAVKVMLREYGADAAFVERFKQEAQAAARLIHPNIAQVYSYGIADGMPYIAMELVAGGSLDRLMMTHPGTLEVARVLKICEQVAQALRCASDQGVVHGDVKPENVLLDANGNAKLVDFGLAAMQKDTSEIWGTPYYIAPEKVRKEAVDYRADMYSLGGTLYHALTGVAPFEGDDATSVVRKRFEGAPRKPSEVRPGLSPQVDALVMKMLALDPADRFPTFEALLAEFKQVLTTGLDGGQSVAGAASAGAAAGAGVRRQTTASGGKRLVIKGRRPAMRLKPDAESEADDATEAPSRISRMKNNLAAMSGEETGPEGDEESSSIGSVFKVVGGIVLAVVLVAGGLLAYLHMDKAKKNAAQQNLIASQYAQAKTAIGEMKTTVESFHAKVENIASNAVATCGRISRDLGKEMRKFYPDEVIAQIELPPPPELIQAVQKKLAKDLNGGVRPSPEALGAVAAAGLGSVIEQGMAELAKSMSAAVTQGVAKAAVALATGVQSNLTDKAEMPVQPANSSENTGEPEAPAPAEPQPAAQAAEAPPAAPVEVPVCVKQMQGLWAKAHEAAIAFIVFDEKCSELLKEFEKSEAIAECNEANMRFLADETKRLKSLFDEVKGMKQVEEIQKAGGSMAKGEKIIKEAARVIRIRIRERERLEAEERDRQQKAEKAAKEKADREELVKNETAKAAEMFSTLLNSGVLRQLDWKGARRQLNALKQTLKTPEGQLKTDWELKKIGMLESMQTILVRNLKDYTFAKGELRGCTVIKVDNDEIVCRNLKDAAAPTRKIAWITFYAKCHTSLNEICNRFIRRGNENGSPKLGARAQTEALLGYAMALKYIFADDEGASDHFMRMVKEAAQRMPSYLETAKELFPEADFSAIEAASSAEQL